LPVITANPAATQSVNAGQPASFSVTATSTAPLDYQWKKGGVNIPGANASTYTIQTTSTTDSGVYSVVVSNSAGTVTSSNAMLTVSPVGPTITAQPASQSVISGGTASFTVTAAGTAPFSYQWKRNDLDIEGATSRTYMPVISSADNGARYRVVVSNSAGHISSDEAILSELAITTQPTALSVVAPATATFTVTAAGTGPLTYQWQKNGSDIADATSNSYTTPATSIGDDAVFKVVVSNSVGTVISSNAGLSVFGTKFSRVSKPDGTQYGKDECVKDNITGLFWEGKTASGDRNKSETYTNYDASNADETDINAASNSIGYAKSVNAASGLCGFTDWRLPTKVELEGIVVYKPAPTIDSDWFINTQSAGYWTSTSHGTYKYAVNFLSSGIISDIRSYGYYVRLVR
ncbi:MAG: immunoglobulin domain-containing protein, partial [Rhodoferax sp.]|nr:immunoglobulin domain-containing protein [Rhodoferax sp.]